VRHLDPPTDAAARASCNLAILFDAQSRSIRRGIWRRRRIAVNHSLWSPSFCRLQQPAHARDRTHLRQGRFSSVAMDEAHLIAALRYVARNPVRGRLVERAEDWR